MSQRLAGHLLVEALAEQGVREVFGVPGESYLAALDGFYRERERLRFITCRQEGGAAYMAEAVGKLTGRPGVCFVTRGPGAANAAVGLHTAFQDSTPMVLLVGDVARGMRDREAFQEVDFARFFGPLAKRVERVDDAARLPEYVARAFATAVNGRPGPAVLVLPEDMLAEPVPDDLRPLPSAPPVEAWPAPGALRDLRGLLLAARQPIVLVGGSGWTPPSAQALQRFAENWQLPVACAFRNQDLFDNHHVLYAGDVGVGMDPALAQRLRAADLLLVVGARLGEATTGGYDWVRVPRPVQKLVHLHASAEELDRVYRADLAILSSMASAGKALEASLAAPRELPWRGWAEAVHADALANHAGEPPITEPVDLRTVLVTAQRLAPADTVFTWGAGNFAAWGQRYVRFPGLGDVGERTMLAPTNGSMGYGVPAGIAAAIATGRTVLTVAGDGDFLMNGQELATAAQHGARPIVLLFNNGSYGTIRMHQEGEFPGRVSGTALRNPDFVALAQAYGFAAARVERTAQFEPAFAAALAADRGTLIEIIQPADLITSRRTLAAIRAAAEARGQD